MPGRRPRSRVAVAVVQSVGARRVGGQRSRHRPAEDPGSATHVDAWWASHWSRRRGSRSWHPLAIVAGPRRRSPHGSWTRRRPRASCTGTTATSPSSSAAAWRHSTATTTGAPTSTSPAAPNPPRCTGTRARWAARSASRQLPSAVTDLTAVTGAYPLDIDGDGHTDLAVLRRGGTSSSAGSETAGSSAPTTSSGIRRRRRVDRRLQRDVGRVEPLAHAGVRQLPRSRRRPTSATTSVLLRPGAGGRALRIAHRAPPRLLRAVRAVQRLGPVGRARPPRGNDRHYYRDGSRSSCGGSSPVKRPACTPRATGGGRCRSGAWASPARTSTGDGRPEVFLTSQGDNKLQTLADGDGATEYEDIALERGVTAQRPYAGGDVLPSTAWHPEFEDVNNDGFVDLFITKGNVEAQPDYAAAGPEQPAARAGRRHVRRGGASRRASSSFERGRGAALVDLNLDGLLDLVAVNRRENVKVWRNVGAGDAERARAAWATGSRCGSEQPAPNRTRSARGWRCESGDRTIDREVTVGGGHAGGQLGWIHVGLGDADAAEVRVQWPDGEIGPWMRLAADQFVTIERGATAVERWDREPSEPCDDATTARAGRGRPARLRDAGREPRSPAVDLRRPARAPPRGDGRPRLRPSRRLGRPRAQREPRLPHRVRPAVRGGGARRRAGGRARDPRRQRVLRHGGCGAAADAPAPVPGPQPARPTARPVAAAERDPAATRASRAGSRVGVVGWKTYADRAT